MMGENEVGLRPTENVLMVGVHLQQFPSLPETKGFIPIALDGKYRVITSPSSFGVPQGISTGQNEVNVPGTPEPVYVGQSGTFIFIRAHRDNKGYIYIQDNVGYQLKSGDYIKICKKKCNEITFDGEFVGDGISWMTETYASELPGVPLDPDAE